MRKPIAFCGLVFLVAAFLSYSGLQNGYLVKNSRFMLNFPHKPLEKDQTIASSAVSLDIHFYIYEVPKGVKDDNRVYGLIEMANSDSVINSNDKDKLATYFRASAEGAAKKAKGTLLSYENIELDGYPGRKYRIGCNHGIIISAREFLGKDHIFVLQTITDSIWDGNASSRRFMDSFRMMQ